MYNKHAELVKDYEIIKEQNINLQVKCGRLEKNIEELKKASKSSISASNVLDTKTVNVSMVIYF